MKPGLKEPPDAVRSLIGTDIDIVGFMIPNEFSTIDNVKEFMLTPIAGGCIHVPPPPPNYIIHVTMEEKKRAHVPFGAVEVHGTLNLTRREANKKMFSFEMVAHEVEDFDANQYMRY